MIRPPPTSTLFPYTTLFRSGRNSCGGLDSLPSRRHLPPVRSRDFSSGRWGGALSLLEQADRLHRQFFRVAGAESAHTWEPPVDVVESAERLDVHIALPGVTPESITIALEPDAVVVSALRPLPRRANGASRGRRARRSSSRASGLPTACSPYRFAGRKAHEPQGALQRKPGSAARLRRRVRERGELEAAAGGRAHPDSDAQHGALPGRDFPHHGGAGDLGRGGAGGGAQRAEGRLPPAA